MVKKIILYVVLIVILIITSFIIYENYKQQKTNTSDLSIKESISDNTLSNNFKFQFDNFWYEFQYISNTEISQKSTGQFEDKDSFKILDSNKQEIASLLILPENAEGPTKQSLGSKNNISIIINGINGENFQSNDGKYVYLLNDNKYIYLWTNQNMDNLIFDEIVKSFKKSN